MPRTNWHSQRLSKAPLSTFGTHRTNRQNQASSSNTQSASNEHHDTITNADNDEEEDDDELPGAYAINRQTSSDNIDEEWDPTATETMTRSAPTEDIRTEDADAVVQSEEIDQKLEDRQAEEQRDQKNKKKRCLMVAGFLLIVAAIAAIVGVVVGQLRDNGDTTAGYADTSFPTDASLLDVLTSPCAGSDIRTSDDMTEVYIDIRSMIAVLLPNATINIDTPHSSQRHALCWVSGFDGFLKPTEESMIQRFALAVVYFSGIQSGLLESAHGGEFTLIDQNWLSAIHECDWKYISCTIDNEIDGLGLFSVGLIGTIPIELCLLTELRVLDMSKNELSGSIPSELSKVTHLERLQLKLNQLTGTILDEAKSLPSSLTDIDFSHNSLSGTISEFLDLPELKSLWLGFSGIGGTFPNLSKSKLLYFSQLYIHGSIPDNFWELSKLTFLNIVHTSISGTVSSQIVRLRELHLSNNNLSGWIPSELGQLSTLEYLNLRNNQFRGTVPAEICTMFSTRPYRRHIFTVDSFLSCHCCTIG